ncbi:hypothetical protein M501DRAFT_989710 [Patellaria atrata CBS 101060]|uniref:CCHC-type domain-containing protein n=1 Tax=Patellaria atrata CBS 101060 TaxID=1346257 RepID=A0A9P4SE90_9PEZI|nr:hypothetical protein M501DRAFT_989710 [Patellaria atrata CBS 101060]
MSSRLLNMKFMQRSAASTTSPSSRSPSTPAGPPSKRIRLSNGTGAPTGTTSHYDAVQTAVAAEELKRSQAVERQAVESGETRWVLSFQEPDESPKAGLQVVTAGYAAIDGTIHDSYGYDHENIPRTSGLEGRRSFGKFNKALEKKQYRASSSSSSSDSESDGEESEEDDGEEGETTGSGLVKRAHTEVGEKLRAERKAKKKAAKAEIEKMADARRKKEIKLNTLTSISGHSHIPRVPLSGSTTNMECYGCGKRGHRKANCPQRGTRRE